MIMEKMKEKIDGIVLYSGGLDSILAYKLLDMQGLRVVALKNYSIFFPLKTSPEEYAQDQKDRFDVDIQIRDVTRQYEKIVRKPRFGYGRWMNPCLDCKLFMYMQAAELMKEKKARFIATGEVVGQRPMTQHKSELNRLEKEAGLRGYVLRPLSARLLKPTEAENSGLVDRSRLLDISGRSRKSQMQLARDMGIENYPSPAGGCLLTDDTFARRLKDMHIYGNDTRVLPLLLTGRHFRLSETCRLIVGRNHEENQAIESHAENADALLMPISHMGPIAIVCGSCAEDKLETATGIVARYGDAKPGEKTVVEIRTSGETSEKNCDAVSNDIIDKLRI